MKICLIQPPQLISTDSASVNRPCLPLGLAYLASSAKSAGCEVQVIDAIGLGPTSYEDFNERVKLLGLPTEKILERIDKDVRFIGVTLMFSFNWPHTRLLLKAIKEKFPEIPLVLGGEAATSCWETCMKETPVDIIAQGEGEETIQDLAKVCARSEWRAELSQVEGIVYRDGESFVQNKRRSRITAVDDIPVPAWDMFDVRAYVENRFENGMMIDAEPAIIPMLATRGCPYDCTFCTSPNMWTRKYVKRDPKLVADEMQFYVEKYGAKNFPFQDLTAIIDKQWIMDFCQELIDRKLNIHWQLPSGTRSEVIDDEVADLLYRSGMYEMGYAPESGSDEIRKHVRKKVKRENLYDSVRAAVRNGLKVQVFFIIGFPFETRRDIWETLKMVARLACMGAHDVGMNHYMALPGTEITNEVDSDWIRELGDDFYFIPLFGHTLKMEDWRKAHQKLSSVELTFYVVFGFALFYTLSFLSHPKKLVLFLSSLFSVSDSSRLQAAIKTLLRHQKKSTQSQMHKELAPTEQDEQVEAASR